LLLINYLDNLAKFRHCAPGLNRGEAISRCNYLILWDIIVVSLLAMTPIGTFCETIIFRFTISWMLIMRKDRIFILLLPSLASILSGVLLILTFPPHNQGWLAWVALVPLLIAALKGNLRQGFSLAYLCGIIYFGLVFRWVFDIPGYTFLHHSILVIYLGSYFGLFGLLFIFLCKRFGTPAGFFVAPFIWVSLEFIRSNIGFMAAPYALLGYTQHDHPIIIQIASLTGATGVSFLLVMVNSGIAALVLTILYRSRNLQSVPNHCISNKGLLITSATAAFLVTLTMCYGIIVVSRPITGKALKVSVVQGNIEQSKKWDPIQTALIMETYVGLTRKAQKDQPDLIVWPETATPGFVLNNNALLTKTTQLIREADSYLLIGSSEYPKLQKGTIKLGLFGNTALFFSPEGRIIGQYLKVRLLPFGEYLPYAETVPWSWVDVPKVNPTLPGREFTILQSTTFRFGTPICWENLFPEIPRIFVKRGAQFLANITNEAWFDKSVGPRHYVISSIFRAVENRVYVVRCANTGISCFIDPYGRITGKVTRDGKDALVEGYLTRPIYLSDEKTFYTRYGDLFIYLCFLVSMVMIGASLWRMKK
jgi:apolipoprotein N-acyltransferase